MVRLRILVCELCTLFNDSLRFKIISVIHYVINDHYLLLPLIFRSGNTSNNTILQYEVHKVHIWNPLFINML